MPFFNITRPTHNYLALSLDQEPVNRGGPAPSMDYKAKNLDRDDAFHKMMITPGIDDAIEMD